MTLSHSTHPNLLKVYKALSALKAKQLQEICMACGLAKSGSKGSINDRIEMAAKAFKPLPSDARILSIDMGIRNMAFCILRPRKPAPAIPSSDDGKQQPSPQPTDTTTPRFRYPSASVDEWKRLSLSAPDNSEDFSPASMAEIAINFIQTHILPHKPTHILIERQRFRSSGSPAILDWTIRVNTLEAMIYSILAVHRSNGIWKGEVVPVAPRRVGTFLLEDNQYTAALVNPQHPTPAELIEHTKKRKVELLARMIQERDILRFENPETESLAGSLVQSARLDGQKNGPKGDYERLTKVDDLADCLLQGLAWLEWQRNTKHFIENQDWTNRLGEKVAGAKRSKKKVQIDLGDAKYETSDLPIKIKRDKSIADGEKVRQRKQQVRIERPRQIKRARKIKKVK